jgi:UDP-N-acetylglucosamine transferase subunit ALG13
VIFVTVGAQMPFDRLCRGVDAWAKARGRGDVFAQIGPTDWQPSHIRFARFLDPPAFKARVAESDAVVAHAGMGSIITALELGKPILVMPRRGDLRETRNDHQVATAQRFLALGRVAVAMTDDDLPAALDRLGALRPADTIGARASDQLIAALRRFIETPAGSSARSPASSMTHTATATEHP